MKSTRRFSFIAPLVMPRSLLDEHYTHRQHSRIVHRVMSVEAISGTGTDWRLEPPTEGRDDLFSNQVLKRVRFALHSEMGRIRTARRGGMQHA